MVQDFLEERLCVLGGARDIWKLSEPSAQFYCRSKTALKNKVCFLEIHMEMKGTKIAKATLIKNKSRELTPPSFKAYYKATAIDTV